MSSNDRRDAEVSLLQAMYPDVLDWNEKSQELKYLAANGANLVLRLPDGYPGDDLPILISATDSAKEDARTFFRREIDALVLQVDEEVCDTILQAFEDLSHKSGVNQSSANNTEDNRSSVPRKQDKYKTVIVWLHHLLATSKRKLALHPSLDSNLVNGITKPGYPGIMMFSGTASAVDAHVAELKDQRWQAFQVRYEESFEQSDDAFQFLHGRGIVEVENMSAVVSDIKSDRHQKEFLKASGVK